MFDKESQAALANHCLRCSARQITLQNPPRRFAAIRSARVLRADTDRDRRMVRRPRSASGVPPPDAPEHHARTRRSSSAKPRHPKRKPRPRRLRHHGFTPTLVIEPSPTLPGSRRRPRTRCCSGLLLSPASAPQAPIPVHLKTLDCPVAGASGSLLTCGDGRPVLMRCVREVARASRADT